jgi:sialidase-1
MTVKLSYDEGETWRVAKTLHPGPSAYSCLTVLQDGSIGMLYERGEASLYERISFARFTLKWLNE